MENQTVATYYILARTFERETQLAIFEPGGTLLQEKRIPTKDLQSFVHSLPAKEKHLALESLGFIYPLYDKLKQASDSKQRHDRADAKLLANLIRTNFFKRSHMSDAETREERFLMVVRTSRGKKIASTRL
jgi:hypothetical protein